ncbi:hypothetical protein HYFRA_00004681 [Hymenoscyphus fraxineus]|uniref:Oxidoreductase acuF-like C2H2 type zinc-finger domain-containing protein n=1 Tax=Hymenoscyphus fraxineus TaxID=746836 RepID=A0A9N9PPL0_9HELO|nr:hypothetical protein HYFRA_00004681 [Hymenoscyphus fraxineus]
MSSAVASQSKACVRHFDELCALFEDEERQFTYDISYSQVCDSYAQFKIWAGNIGALQTIPSASSLDYRLREVPKVSGQVISVLEDLEEVLQDVIAIALGKRENRIGSPVPLDHELLDEDYGSASQPTSEIQELFQSISETIASLFKLSILIRNSSSRDRYAKALAAASKAPFDDHFDIDHVGNKFPRLCGSDREWLGKRLGKAITQKRQYLYYCREHRETLSRAPGLRDVIEITPEPIIGSTSLTVQKQNSTSHDDAQTVISRPTSTLAPTTASTVIATKLESAMRLGDVEEEAENDNRSQTSYATSIGEDESDNRLSIIRLEEVAGTAESFECPYCWTIQKINNQRSWR